MASGRLGSAYIGPKRTAQIYANSSGGAASLSIMAQAKSTTANTPISVKIDSGSTAAETTTQIDSSSYTQEDLALLYNSTVTSLEGKVLYGSYSTASNVSDVQPQVNPFPSGTNTGTDENGYQMPKCFNVNFWTGHRDYFPIWDGANFYARWSSKAQVATAGVFNFVSAQMNKGFTNRPASTAFNYNQYASSGRAADEYCKQLPVFSYQSNRYMSVGFLQGGGTTSAGSDRTTNSLHYWMSGNSPSGQNGAQQFLFASGGMLVAAHGNDNTVILRYYGLEPSDNIFGNTITENPGDNAGNTDYPFDIWVETSGRNATGYPEVVYHEYNPHNKKIYTLMNMGLGSAPTMKRVLFEWDTDKLYSLQSSGTQGYSSSNGTGRIENDWQTRIFDAGLATDKTSSIPDAFTSNTVKVIAPMMRVADKRWVIGVRDPYASPSVASYWQTTDLQNWTQISSSNYYEENYDDDTFVESTGSVTNKITNNFGSLPDAGLLEHELSVNNYERTGLVLSNNDKVYVRNHGDTAVAVSAMGYEE